MADVGHQRFTKSVFYTPPLTAKSSENFHYQLVWCWLVLINVKMLVMTKKNQICPILLIIKILDQKCIFWVFSRTLVIDFLSRQSMLQINDCGRKSNAYS